MALKDLKTTKKSKKGFDPGYGVMLEVVTAEKDGNGGVKMKGKILNSTSFAQAGEMVIVVADDAEYNMVKGGAKFGTPQSSAGTILTLEGCRQKSVDRDERTLSAKYVKTLKSNSKKYDEGDRDFKSVMASAPVIAFENVNPAAGEPKYIKWATNTDGVRSTVKNAKGDRQTIEFGRDWLATKYADAQAAGKKVHVYMDVLRPERAVLAANEQDFYDLVKANSAMDQNMVLAVRAYDSGSIMTRKIEQRLKKDEAGKYNVDAEGLVESLKKGRVIGAIENNAGLFEQVANGDINLEVIPGTRMRFPTDSALSMIKQSLLTPPKDKDGNTLNPMSFIFGDKAFNYAKVLLPGLVTQDNRFMPINIVREEPGRVDLYTMTTPATPVAPGTVPAVPTDDDAHADDATLDQSLDANLAFDEDLTEEHSLAASSAPGV